MAHIVVTVPPLEIVGEGVVTVGFGVVTVGVGDVVVPPLPVTL